MTAGTTMLKRALRHGGVSTGLIKGEASSEPLPGYVPGYSASGQDIWLPTATHFGPGLVLSAVGARCGKVFLADGKWSVVANTVVLTPQQGHDPKFLWYLINYEGFWEKGGTAQPYVRVPETLARHVWLPPLAEQQAIADYLDAETTRIDALISKKQQLVHLLEERFASAIAAAQDSWSFVPLKRLVRWREGPGIMAADFRDVGVPLIRLAGVGGDNVTLQGCNHLDPALVDQRWSHFRLRKGDYLISASASMGVVSRVGSEAEGAVPYTGLIIFRPLGETDMEFMRWFLQGPAFMRQIDLLKTGTAIQHFGPIHLEAIGCPSPTPLVQRRIGQQLAALRFQVDVGTQALARQIDLLAEHRQALITAAVTGEFSVPRTA